MSARRSALLSPGQSLGAVSNDLAFDHMLVINAPVEPLAISGRHRQHALRGHLSLERAIAPPDPCAAIGNRQPGRSAKGCARFRSGIALSEGASTGEGVAGTVVLCGNADISPVEGACRIRRRWWRLRIGRQAPPPE